MGNRELEWRKGEERQPGTGMEEGKKQENRESGVEKGEVGKRVGGRVLGKGKTKEGSRVPGLEEEDNGQQRIENRVGRGRGSGGLGLEEGKREKEGDWG